MQDLHKWYQLCEQLRVLKKQELELRKSLFASHFPEPDEGVNHCDIQGGELVGTYPYRYTLDPDNLEEGLAHIPVTKQEKLIVYKPTMVKAVYNKLSVQARKKFTAACITVTPGTPSLKIVPTAPADVASTPGK